MRYFDSSALVKLYVVENQAADASRYFDSSLVPPPFTLFHGIEFRCAIRQKETRGEISSQEGVNILAVLRDHLNAGIYHTPALNWPDVFLEAELLLAAHGASSLCRTLDLLHVACARVLRATEFCSFDIRQCQMAQLAGFTVLT